MNQNVLETLEKRMLSALDRFLRSGGRRWTIRRTITTY